MPLRVLIVDDDPWFPESARKLLGARGFAVAGGASDYKEALAAVRELDPDGVLVDVHLPDVDGFEVAGQLSGGEPPVLLTSSDPEAPTSSYFSRAGPHADSSRA